MVHSGMRNLDDSSYRSRSNWITKIPSLYRILLVFLFVFMLSLQNSFGQLTEMGFEIGAFNFSGDLSRNYNLKSHRPAASLYLRSNISNGVGLKYGISGGMLSGKNKLYDPGVNQSSDEYFNVYLLEAFGVFEFYFLDYKSINSRVHWTPYLSLGLGVFTFLGDVTKNADYSKVQPAIPFGIGFKYQVSKKIDLGIEASARATFFDELDGVGDDDPPGQDYDLGNKYDFDAYFYIGFTLNYTFYFIPCPYGYD